LSKGDAGIDTANVCMGCRFGSIKMDVLVPEKYDMKQLVAQIQILASEVTAVAASKPIHYSFTFGAGKNSLKKPKFKVDCLCIFKVKQRDCSRLNPKKGKEFKVRHFDQDDFVSEAMLVSGFAERRS
jgi:hypothetical protein